MSLLGKDKNIVVRDELEVKGTKFYLLVQKGKNVDLRLYVDLDVATQRIKALLKKGINSEELELTAIELKGEEYAIKSVPWHLIATKLVKEEK
jgi:hypothetical protein